MKRLAFLAVLMALILTACGGQATPTVDPAQIQASAVAAASTMVAMTQGAMPTPSPIPPTDLPSPTPLPSPTLLALPTMDTGGFPTAALPTSASGTTTTDCNHLLDVKASGTKTITLLIQNTTNGPVTVTVGLSKKNAFGQCGYISWSNILKRSSMLVDLPQTGAGPCYWSYAWVNDPKQQRSLSGTPFCWNSNDKIRMIISYDMIKVQQ